MTFKEKKDFINQVWTYKTFNKGEDNEKTITVFNDEGIEPYTDIYREKERTEKEKIWEDFKHICFEKGMKVDDYWYDWLNEAFEEIKVIIENCENEEQAIECIEEAELEPETDIYTYDLTKWLHSKVERVYYISDALMEGWGDDKDGFRLLTGAQWKEMNEVYYVAKEIVIEFLKN